jgi:hypothetical protein
MNASTLRRLDQDAPQSRQSIAQDALQRLGVDLGQLGAGGRRSQLALAHDGAVPGDAGEHDRRDLGEEETECEDGGVH